MFPPAAPPPPSRRPAATGPPPSRRGCSPPPPGAADGTALGPPTLALAVVWSEEVIHLREVRAAATAPDAVAQEPDIVPEVVANERRVMPVEARHAQVPRGARRENLIRVHVGRLHDEHVLHDVQPVLLPALEGGEADLVRPVVVVH